MHRPKVSDPMQFYVRCFPHVINVVCQRVIKALEELSGGSGDDDDDDEIDRNDQVPASILSKVRALIRTIRASGQRQAAFREVIHKGNQLGYWVEGGETLRVQPRNLILDVRTRWDSTYQMLVRLHELRRVSG